MDNIFTLTQILNILDQIHIILVPTKLIFNHEEKLRKQNKNSYEL